MAVVSTSVVARKRHRCDEYGDAHSIRPGETYVRSVAFPDGDINTDTVPWVLKLCETHWTRYGRPMPVKKSSTSHRGAKL